MIFIVGNSRSGTTMMSRILGNNINVCQFQEIHFFEWMIDHTKFKETISKKEGITLLNKMIGQQSQNFYKLTNLNQYELESKHIIENIANSEPLTPISIYRYFLSYWSEKNDKRIACEQTPKNVFYINELCSEIPNAKIVNMVRDPRAIMLSQKNKWKRRFYGESGVTLFETIRAWSLYHPLIICKMWKSAIEAAERNEYHNILTVKFESVILSPKNELLKICDYCDIKYEESMLNVPQIGSSLGQDIPSQLGVDSNKVLTWNNGNLAAEEIFIAEKLLSKSLRKYGYPRTEVRINYLKLVVIILIFPIKLGIAFLLNLSRMGNIKNTLMRRFG